MSSPSTHLDKNTLREQGLRARKGVAADEATAVSQKIAQHLMLFLPPEKRVACYLAIQGELDLYPAMQQLAARGQKLCLPVVTEKGKALVFREWKPGDALEKGAYDINVPVEAAHVVMPDDILVPMACFDGARHRIGYGGGYYDRTIRALRDSGAPTRFIGIAYACQQVMRIPVASHDERLDEIVTENGVIA